MFIKRLLLPCPLSFKTDFAAPDTDFEQVGDSNYLKLYIDRTCYVCEKTYASGNTQYTRSLSTVTLQFKAYFKVLEIKVLDERSHLLALISAISRNSFSADLQTQTPVQLVDFVMPEDADIKSAIASNTEPNTVRYGLLKDIQVAGGAVGTGIGQQLYLKDGFTFRFEELVMRRD